MPTEAPLIAAPPSADRVRALADRMEQLQHRFERARDERAIFACVYGKITGDLAVELGRPGAFDDPGWVMLLMERFAGRYFAAMEAIDAALAEAGTRRVTRRDLEAAGPWADVYLAIDGGRGYVFESLVFSMVAHIGYDLPLALLEAGMTPDGRSKVRDFHRMNDVLGDQVDAMERLVADRYQPLLRTLSKWSGRFGLTFTNYGIRLSRAVAWYNADRLSDPASVVEATGTVLRSTANFIDGVRRPKEWPLRVLVWIARVLIPRRHHWPTRPAPSRSAPYDPS